MRCAALPSLGRADQLPDDDFRSLLLYWQQRSVDRPMARHDIDVLELPPHLLPDLVLADIHDTGEVGGPMIRYRLAGSRIVAAFPREIGGRRLDEVFASTAWREYLRGLYGEMVLCRRPLFTLNLSTRKDRPEMPLRIHRLMLPLATSGMEVDGCLAIQTFDWVEDARISDYAHAEPGLLREALCLQL